MQFFSQMNQEMQIFLVTILSLVFGSFVSLITYRFNRDEPIILTRSKCVNCGCKLKILNLIPLFSWAAQKGKCSKCKCKISLRYPLIEFSFLVAFLTIYFVVGKNLEVKTWLYFAIAGTMIAISIIDLEQYFIPNKAQYLLAVFVILLVIIDGGSGAAAMNVKSAFLYAGFGIGLWAFFYFIARISAIGIDDIKFLFIAGLLLGVKDFLAFMILSGVCGLVFGAIWQKVKQDETFPFAPALCLTTFICMLFDKKINPVDLLGSLLFFQGFGI